MKAADIDIHETYASVQQHAGHRGPYEAGGADRYYGRQYNPNFTWNGMQFTEQEMASDQCLEYQKGWLAETNRKDWLHEPRHAEDDYD